MRLLIVNVNPEAQTSEGCRAIAGRLASLAPQATILQWHWAEGNLRDAVLSARADAIVLGPNGTPFAAYPSAFVNFLRAVRDHQGPLLGICGGHQVLALAHGAEVGPVYDVPAATTSYEGMPKVSGGCSVRICAPHPVLDGLPPTFEATASHVDEVKELPPNFQLLGAGEVSKIQVMSHLRRPQLGMQFHPERPVDSPHGTTLLRNWVALLEASI